MSLLTSLLSVVETNWLAIVIALLAVITLRHVRYLLSMPPGPWGLPILGYYPFISKEVCLQWDKFGRKYGPDLWSITLMGKTYVIAHSFEANKQIVYGANHNFNNHTTEFNYFNGAWGGITMGNINGAAWVAHRKFTAFNLLQWTAPLMQQRLIELNGDLANFVRSHNGEPFNIREALNITIASAISYMAYRKKYAWDDPILTQLRNDVATFFMDITDIQPSMCGTWWRILRGNILFPSHRSFLRRQKRSRTMMRGLVDDRLKSGSGGSERDYVDNFMDEMQKPGAAEKNFTEEGLPLSMHLLFQAGSETTTQVIYILLFEVARNKHIQDRIHKELDAAIGDREFTAADKPNVQYLQAVIEETLRISVLAPFGITRVASTDSTVCGYTIKAGTHVITNYYPPQRDPKIWKTPNSFDPENFLDAEGNFVRNPAMFTFGAGKRNCAAEVQARQMLISVCASLLQKFSFETTVSERKMIDGFVRLLEDFELVATERKLS